MRIIRSSDLPAVVLVKGRGVRALAIPENLPTSEVLELARLVLSASEYEELWHAVQSSARLDPPRAGPPWQAWGRLPGDKRVGQRVNACQLGRQLVAQPVPRGDSRG
jgi:hypothetical protein